MRGFEEVRPKGSERDPGSGKVDAVAIAGMFKELADAEQGFNEKAQGQLEGMGGGLAAELLGWVVDKGG